MACEGRRAGRHQWASLSHTLTEPGHRSTNMTVSHSPRPACNQGNGSGPLLPEPKVEVRWDFHGSFISGESGARAHCDLPSSRLAQTGL